MADRWPSARDLMTPKPITLSPDATVARALGLMRAHKFHELPVLARNRLHGMVTFESIARRSNLALTTKVEHVMVLPPVVNPTTLYPELAEQLLAAGLRAAPVVDRKGALTGLVSRTDLVRAVPDIPMMAGRKVSEIAEPSGPVLNEHDSIARLFAETRLLEEHPVAVVDRLGRAVGALGLSDLTQVLWRPVRGGKRDMPDRGPRFDIDVGGLMRSPPLTVTPDTTVGKAAGMMSRERASSVFLVEEGRPTGIVTQSGILGLAVGGGEAREGAALGDVFVQLTGMRGSSDPAVLTEIDSVVAKGLRRISKHVRPLLLSLHVTPHATHRSGEVTVQGRLHTERTIYYASRTEWNVFLAIATLLEEIETQVRRIRETRPGHHRPPVRTIPAEVSPVDPELEARIRTATGEE